MQRIFAFVVVAGLASGLIGAFAYDQLGNDAGAAPSATQVREQNLDGSGFIRVHEQGTTNVSVTNSALPIAGTVNVGNLPTDAQGNVRVAGVGDASARLVLVAENVSLPSYPDQFFTGFFPTADCSRLAVFTNHDSGLTVNLKLSADGAVTHLRTGMNRSPNDGGSVLYFSAASGFGDLTAPYAGVEFQNNQTTPVTISKAWIWCEP